MLTAWRRCSSCKTDINFDKVYWECSVSTCTRSRTAYYFCSVACWEMHLPLMRHREAFAVEARAPSATEWAAQQAAENEPAEPSEPDEARPAPRRQLVTAATPEAAPTSGDDRDILVVVSKLKKYIKDRSGMNTSDGVMNVLSDHLRWIADLAVQSARQAGRKTILDRDVPPVPRR